MPYTSGIAFQFGLAGSGEGVTVSLVAGSNFFYYLEIIVDSCKKYEGFSAYPSFGFPMVATHENIERYRCQDADISVVKRHSNPPS